MFQSIISHSLSRTFTSINIPLFKKLATSTEFGSDEHYMEHRTALILDLKLFTFISH